MSAWRVAMSCSCTASTTTAQPRQYRPVPFVIWRTCSTWPCAAAGRSRSMHARPSIPSLVTVAAPTRRALPRRALTTTPCKAFALLCCAGSVALSPSPGHVGSEPHSRTPPQRAPHKAVLPRVAPRAAVVCVASRTREGQPPRLATPYPRVQMFWCNCTGFVTLFSRTEPPVGLAP